jgi:RNA polymerase sigma-70 factor (ECF subfamily)
MWPTTPWSEVGRLGGPDVEGHRQALSYLVQAYSPALRRHLIFRLHIHPSEVDDLLQEFVQCKIIEKDILRLAKQERGRFRTFLATALDRFVLNQIRNQNARNRHTVQFETVEQLEGAAGDVARQPDIFELAWARQVFGQAMRRMRTRCIERNRVAIWGVFCNRSLLPLLHERDPVPFDVLVKEFGLDSPQQAFKMHSSGVAMFGGSVRAVIGRYVDNRADIESEVRDLREILSKKLGRLR